MTDYGTVLPLLSLRGMVVFPHMVVPLEVGRERSIAAVEQAMMQDRRIVLAAQKDAKAADPKPDGVYRTGVLAVVKQLMRMPEGQIKVLVEALERCRIGEFVQEEPYFAVRAEAVDPGPGGPEDPELAALVRAAKRYFAEYERHKRRSEAQSADLEGIEEPGRLADLIAARLEAPVEKKQPLLEALDVRARLESLCFLMASEIELIELERRIQAQVKRQMERSQREYYLREQMKAIQSELGEQDARTAEIQAFREKIESLGMPGAAKEKALHELGRLEKMPQASAEAVVVRTYLEWLTSLPWSAETEDVLDIDRAVRILDEDHYGLQKVKDRICEFLAVRRLKQSLKGPILCLVGPPGVGKTSLGRSVARALGRKFVRISLGGVRDEAEIRGHRRTYVGAMPGKIIQAMRQAGTRNPVLLLDEVDKLSSDFRGDPAASLLEALDPEQNAAFGDHYLEVPFDLSRVLFITTANVVHTILRPLRDRMEIVDISGYTQAEKFQIAKLHLIPKQIEEHGLTPSRIKISDNVVRRLIDEYTRESGVRGLERQIAALCRKAAREIVAGKENVTIDARRLERYLGPPPFRVESGRRRDQVGVACGLAYTEVGGSTITIEVSVVEGKGRLTLTGKLGEVMKESAQAAFSFVRSRAESLGVPPDFYQAADIHVHIPEGAVPKEGPSAGITIGTALASALTGRAVRADVAMTGEVTLRGRVLPVGGIKEKVLAAHRAGIEEVVLPAENRKDLEEVPADVRRKLRFHFVEEMDDVLKIALLPQAVDGLAAASLGAGAPSGEQESWIEESASPV